MTMTISLIVLLHNLGPICNVRGLNNTVAVFMVLHYGFDLVISLIRPILHGGKL